MRVISISLLLVLVALSATVFAQGDPDTLSQDFALIERWTHLPTPTGVRFAKDGRAFILTKGGFIYSVKMVTGTEKPVKVADISVNVYNNFDRGLTGLAPHPDFPETPIVYALFGRDGKVGDPAVGGWGDACPSGICIGSGAVGRFTWDPVLNSLTNYTDIVVDWCTGSETHQVGDLRFDGNGNLLISAGDASFYKTGINFGDAPNPCPLFDPQNPGDNGALLAQNVGSPLGKLSYLTMKQLMDFEATHQAPTLNIHAEGFRNPYRFTVDPETSEIYLGDVGDATWEELNHIPAIGSAGLGGNATIPNYGWPCYEGPMKAPALIQKNSPKCNPMFSGEKTYTPAMWQYNHRESFGDVNSPSGGQSAITGLGIYKGAAFGDKYKNSLWFPDYTRKGIWTMLRKPDNSGYDTSNESGIKKIVENLEQVVDVTPGTDGNIYLTQIWQGKIWQLIPAGANGAPPQVHLKLDKTYGPLNLMVNMDASETTDPMHSKNGQLKFEWDFLGNNKFMDWGAKTWYRYRKKGVYNAKLRVTSPKGAATTYPFQIFAGYDMSGEIQLSVSNNTFGVGDMVEFSADIRDENGVAIPASQYTWSVMIAHCYPGPPCLPDVKSCHQHQVINVAGVSKSSTAARDHDFPSYYTYTLDLQHPTQTDLKVTKYLEVYPAAIHAVIDTNPQGLNIIVNMVSQVAPYSHNNLDKGMVSLDIQPEQMTPDRQAYRFSGWSQGGNTTQSFAMTTNQTTYTAKFDRYDIPVLPAGKQKAPSQASGSGGWRTCTASWSAPLTAAGEAAVAAQAKQQPDPNAPTTGLTAPTLASNMTDSTGITNYIIYYRELKWNSPDPEPKFATAMVPATVQTWDFDNVDVASKCQFQISAVTADGEGDKSSIAETRSLLVVPPSVRDCPEQTCTYKAALIDDWNHPTIAKNLVPYLQEPSTVDGYDMGKYGPAKWEVVNDKLHFKSNSLKPNVVYWYSMLTDPSVKCLAADVYYTHLTFKITAPAGTDFQFGMHSRDKTCTDQVPKIWVNLKDVAKMDGTEQTIKVPIQRLTSSPRGVMSVFFQQFNTDADIYFDDLALVNDCAYRSSSDAGQSSRVPSAFSAGAMALGCAYMAL
ncbi:hypothetical protein RI367_003926 [Sorochytrium milnesiophthora]